MKNKKQNEPKIYAKMLRVVADPDPDWAWKIWATWHSSYDETCDFDEARQEGPAIIYADGYRRWSTGVVEITDTFTYEYVDPSAEDKCEQ